MSAVDTHSQIAAFIWSICNKLRGPYKRNQYRKVILPLTVLRRFDAVLEPTKEAVLKEYEKVKGKSENVQFSVLTGVSGVQFYNTSKLSFANLLADPNNLAVNLNGYINAFSPNVRKILQEFEFSDEVVKMAEKNILFLVVKAFKEIDLSPSRVDDMQMGYIFEELIRIGSEESHEEAGDHFTPREIIKLMVNLLLSDEEDLAKSHVVKTIYDPTCGTGGMLSVAEEYIRSLNTEANPVLYGQDFNLRNIPEAMLERLDDFFGPMSTETIEQTIEFARWRAVANIEGTQITSTKPASLRDLWPCPTLWLHGSDNGLLDPVSPLLTQMLFDQAGIGDRLQVKFLPGTGHQDTLVGPKSDIAYTHMKEHLNADLGNGGTAGRTHEN